MDMKSYQHEYQKIYRKKNAEKRREYYKNYLLKMNINHYDKYKDSIKKCYERKRDEILAKNKEQVLCSCQKIYSRKYLKEHLNKQTHWDNLKRFYLNELQCYNV